MADDDEPFLLQPDAEPPKRSTFAFIVASPVDRVGKTLTSRLVLDYFLSSARPVAAFDSNHFDPELSALFPTATTVVDLTSTRGQMALFDALVQGDETPKVVDLWHNSYELFFRQAAELGFFEEAWGRGVEPVVVLLTDQKERFRRELRTLAADFRGVKIVLVHNQGATSLPDEIVQPKPFTLAHHMLVLPEIDLVVRRAIEAPDVLIDRMIREASLEVSLVIQSRLRALLGPFFDQFESLERKLILENASFLG
jgi:hypothetical protein